jgi:hypothetical protein
MPDLFLKIKGKAREKPFLTFQSLFEYTVADKPAGEGKISLLRRRLNG